MVFSSLKERKDAFKARTFTLEPPLNKRYRHEGEIIPQTKNVQSEVCLSDCDSESSKHSEVILHF